MAKGVGATASFIEVVERYFWSICSIAWLTAVYAVEATCQVDWTFNESKSALIAELALHNETTRQIKKPTPSVVLP